MRIKSAAIFFGHWNANDARPQGSGIVMLARLFALVGVDYVQWKAVSRTLLRSDFRPLTPQSSETYSLSSIGGVVKMALTFGIFGLVTALVIAFNPDVLLTGIITLTYFTFALVTALLTQHGATLFSIADHVILGPRPVSSRTLFAIRLTNVLFHTLLTTTFMAYPAIIAFTVAHGVNPGRGIAGAVAIYGWTATVAFAIVAAYGWILRVIGGARLQRTLGYVQLMIGVFAYGGFFLVSEAFNRQLRGVTLPDSPLLLLVPPAWFASLIEIATGELTTASITRAAFSVASIAGAFMLLHGRLAAGYAERVAELAHSAPARARVHARRPWLFVEGEARAVAILVRAHFRHDVRVRMGVLGVVPLMLIYVFQGMRRGSNPDPFLPDSAGGAVDLLALAMLMFPAIVTRQLESSEAYRGAWIYSVTTASRARLVAALKNVAAAYFLAPFAVMLSALFAWRFGHVGHALTHATILATVSYLALQAAMLVSPKLPFAQPPDKRAESTALFVWMFAVLIGGQLLIFAIQRFVYPSWTRIAALLLGLALIAALLEAALLGRVGRTKNEERRTKNGTQNEVQ